MYYCTVCCTIAQKPVSNQCQKSPKIKNMANRNFLKINDGLPAETVLLIQAINENPYNRLISKNSVFLIQTSVKRVSKAANRYYGVRLVEPKHGSYIEYHHRIPEDIFKKLPPELIKKAWLDKNGIPKEWARFRVKGLLNSVAEEAYDAYAASLLHSVQVSLQNGFDPFQTDIKAYEEGALQLSPVMQITKVTKPKVTVLNCIEAFLKQYPTEKEKKPYRVITNVIEENLESTLNGPIQAIATDDLRDVLRDLREEKEWKKSTYNDKVKKLRTFFNFAKDIKKWIKESPADSIALLTKVDKARHTAFKDKDAAIVKRLMLEHEMQPRGYSAFRFCMAVYYTLTRPVEETRQMKCKDIDFERKIVNIDPERAKGGQGGPIPMAPELEAMFIEMGVDKAPGEHYIFGEGDKVGPIAVSVSWFSWFWREKIRRANGLNEDFTVYSWKHTRVIDLYLSGVKAADLQRMCRHRSATEFEEYLRDLGLDLSQDINLNAKKF